MAEKNRVFFKTVAEAEAAGYKRAGNCPAEETPVRTSAGNGSAAPKTISSGTSLSKTSSTNPSTAGTGAKVSLANDNQPSSGLIVGNKNSKIYHVPGCSTYNSVSEKNRVIFNNADEAEKAGYRKAKNCH
jgi:methylphosphotriester-DNA--protein-cysteine methyltransferase